MKALTRTMALVALSLGAAAALAHHSAAPFNFIFMEYVPKGSCLLFGNLSNLFKNLETNENQCHVA